MFELQTDFWGNSTEFVMASKFVFVDQQSFDNFPKRNQENWIISIYMLCPA